MFHLDVECVYKYTFIYTCNIYVFGLYSMDAVYNKKAELQEEYRNKLLDLAKESSHIRVGKPVKIRVTKKARPSSKRYNEKFIEMTDELAMYKTKRGDHFRARAFQKANESLVMHPHEINASNYKELSKLPGIGETMIHKFGELIETGSLRALERERNDPKNIFSDIYGVGPKKADSLVEKGVKTLEELKSRQNELLNEKQKIGLRHYDDILKRIPRSEIDDYAKVFQASFDDVKTDDAEMQIVGSYRRGAQTSGDIDVIVTSSQQSMFNAFMDKLLEKNIITDVLSRGNTKSLVVGKLPSSSTHRRIDFLYTPKDEYPFALLYFTGSKIFNTVMRARALSMNYSLNEHGIYKMDGKKKGDKVQHHFATEEDIFQFLNMEYKAPQQRINGRSVSSLLKNTSPALSPQKKTKNFTRKLRNSEKEAAKALKEEAKALKKREKEEAKALKAEAKALKTMKKTQKKREKEEAKALKKTQKNREKEQRKQQKEAEKQKKTELNMMKKEDKQKKHSKVIMKTRSSPKEELPVLEAIENYKKNGYSVLEHLNEATLQNMLSKANEVYRNMEPGDQPLLTDNQYDILEDYIKEKFPKNNVVGKIGAPVEKNKIALPYEMASMDKIKPDTKALPSWKSKYKGPYVLSSKLDGVSGLYMNMGGSREGLYTRGDGKIGQDISYLIPHLRLPQKESVVVRGEFIISKATFRSKYQDRFANARNLVAGAVNRVSVSETIQDVDFVAYEVIEPSLKPSEQMKFLESSGFITVKHEFLEDVDNSALSSRLVDWRENDAYEIDGIIASDDKIYPRKSGNPDHSFAFKMALSDQMAETKVLDVIWTASKDGYLKPRVRIEPVRLSGVKIEYATGFNGSFIESNKIGVGAVVELIRSGDVIPYIRRVVTPAESPLMPSIDYVWNDKHIDIMLKNKDDDKTVREKNIAGFFKGIDVEGLGSKNVIKIMESGYDSVPKILAMTKKQLLLVDGFKEKMAEKIHSGIREKIQGANLVTIMSASNMFGRGFSDKKIELILREYPDIFTSTETPEEKVKKLQAVKGMALKTAQAFVEHIPQFVEFLRECKLDHMLNSGTRDNLNESVSVSSSSSHKLSQKVVVMSGSRDKELEKRIKSVGGIIGSSVSSKTFAVITPDIDSSSSKVAAAKSLSIPVMTPSAFSDAYFASLS